MPLKRTAQKLARKLGCLGSQEPEEQARPIAIQPGLEPDEAQDSEPARPYQAFVENEARKYWQEIAKEHNLPKPSQQEIRAAAMPILCQALRNRTGHRRHQAVAVMVQHAYENNLIRQPFSGAYESPSYIEALIQLADDTHWMAMEIPLPDHPPPYHPPVYYTIKPGFGEPVPVPREDAIIRGNYLYPHRRSRSLLINNSAIYPRFNPWSHGVDRGFLDTGRAYYTLSFGLAEGPEYLRPVHIIIHWKDHTSRYASDYISADIRRLHFSPRQPGSKQT